ncbi:MAG: ABC transporter ATP-binding protein, partial [Flavobacteriales bacterium]
ILNTRDLGIGFENKKEGKNYLLKDLSLNINKGELTCLVGANGSGKSTLIRTLAGFQTPLNGDIFIKNHHIKNYKQSELAKELSVVLTEKPAMGNLSAFDLISFGRYPYTDWYGTLSKKDIEITEWAIDEMKIKNLRDKHIGNVSDGELQKIMIGRALAQNTPLMLLDEPTAHLDIQNRVSIIGILRYLTKETNKGILLSTHELEVALQVADNIWLIDNEQELNVGVAEDIVLDGIIHDIFKGSEVQFDSSSGTFEISHMKNGKSALIKGNGDARFWTKRAMIKEGFDITNDNKYDLIIEIECDPLRWKVKSNEDQVVTKNIKELKEVINKKI